MDLASLEKPGGRHGILTAIAFVLGSISCDLIISQERSLQERRPAEQVAAPPGPQSARMTQSAGEDHWLLHPSARLPRTSIERAKFPVVDCHTHFWVKGRHDEDVLRRYVAMMDRNNIAISVSLDGTLGPQLERHVKFLQDAYADRFVIFANIDFRGAADEKDFEKWECNQPHFIRNVVEQLRDAKRKNWISGLKFFKDFGLGYRDARGELLRVDDPRWDPIWEVCGELGLPVLMHTADPSAFFRPITEINERKRELEQHPDWSFHGDGFPTRDALLEARNRVVGRHPNTRFIAAHFGNDAEDLSQLSEWLERYSNLYVEFASRINELGRQPYTARDFFLRYQDRILFGTDGPWPEKRLHAYWRFLETKDEYFVYSDKVPPPQGDWNIYGIFLEEEVLRKIYHENAVRLIPGLRERLSKRSIHSDFEGKR